MLINGSSVQKRAREEEAEAKETAEEETRWQEEQMDTADNIRAVHRSRAFRRTAVSVYHSLYLSLSLSLRLSLSSPIAILAHFQAERSRAERRALRVSFFVFLFHFIIVD